MNTLSSSALVRRRAFTLLELLAVVSIIFVIAALLFPSLKNMQQKAGQAKCVGNLRVISNGFAGFLGENNNVYPGSGPTSASGQSGSKYFRWMHRIGPYMDFGSNVTMRSSLGSPAVPTLDTGYTQALFHCPATAARLYRAPNPPIESVGVYGYNDNIGDNNVDMTKITGVSAAVIQRPSRTILLADRFPGGGSRPQDTVSIGANVTVTDPYPIQTHGASANHRPDRNPAADPKGAGACTFLFVDGHVEVLELARMRPWIDKAANTTGITFKLAGL